MTGHVSLKNLDPRSNRGQILRALSDDPERPTSHAYLRDALPGMAQGTLARELHDLVKVGAIQRIGHGQYVRLVGEVAR